MKSWVPISYAFPIFPQEPNRELAELHKKQQRSRRTQTRNCSVSYKQTLFPEKKSFFLFNAWKLNSQLGFLGNNKSILRVTRNWENVFLLQKTMSFNRKTMSSESIYQWRRSVSSLKVKKHQRFSKKIKINKLHKQTRTMHWTDQNQNLNEN